MNSLTHFDAQGQAHMVDVGAKAATHRSARSGKHASQVMTPKRGGRGGSTAESALCTVM